MRTRLLVCFVLLIAACSFGQTVTAVAPLQKGPTCPQIQQFDIGWTASGKPATVANDCGAANFAANYEITGSPSPMSIVLQGCHRGKTTAQCDTLDTNTATSSSKCVCAAFTIVYDYFTITPTWTGANVTVTAHSTTSPFAKGSSSGSSTFTASGDVTGTGSGGAFPSTVVGINNIPLCNGFAPNSNEFLQYSIGLTPTDCFTTATPTGLIGTGTPNGIAHYIANKAIGSDTPPALRGLYSEVWNLASDATAPPAPLQAGFGGRSITGASTTDTVLYSDVTSEIDHDVAASGTVAETLGVPTTSVAGGGLGNAAFAYKYCNHSAQTDTITPTTFTIQSGTGTAQTSLSVAPGLCYSIKVDPANPTTNWLAELGGGVPSSTPYALDTGVANALAVAIPASANWPATIATGLCLHFKAANASTGATTLAASPIGVTAYGAIALDKRNAAGVAAIGGSGDIVAGGIYGACYDGTEWVLESVSAVITAAGNASAQHQIVESNGTGDQVTFSPNILLDSTHSFFKTFNGILTTGNGQAVMRAAPTVVTTGSGTSISSTSLCTAAICPSGMYRFNVYVDVTTACTTTGTYQVNLIFTDDQGSKTVAVPLIGTGVTFSAGGSTITDTLGLASTANFGAGTMTIFSSGSTTINYSTTATACGTGGPMVGKMHISLENAN